MIFDPALVERFASELRDLLGAKFLADGRVGLAVSGGTDSLALAVLAASAMPGRVVAATVDHGLQSQSAAWAEQAAAECARIGIPHRTLTVDWGAAAPTSNRQAQARVARYAALGSWLAEQGLGHLATAHHLDDQAETLIMRLGRGSGVGGLAGVRARQRIGVGGGRHFDCVRPLLSFRRVELEQIVAEAGLSPVDDPANRDSAHDRTNVRAFLALSPDFPDRLRLAKSSANLDDADQALEWAAVRLADQRRRDVEGGYELDVSDIPRELRRRMARAIVAVLDPAGDPPRGDVLARAICRIESGAVATLTRVVIRPDGDIWRFEPAPPRRPTS